MSHCTDPDCNHDHSNNSIFDRRRSLVIPLAESDAWIIDEARRALIARATLSPMLPPTPELLMATYEVDMPPGNFTVEFHYLLATFIEDIPTLRGRVSNVLRGHFGVNPKIVKESAGVWRYILNHSCKMAFEELRDIHVAIRALTNEGVTNTRVQGLYAKGIFVFEQSGDHMPAFRICGDLPQH